MNQIGGIWIGRVLAEANLHGRSEKFSQLTSFEQWLGQQKQASQTYKKRINFIAATLRVTLPSNVAKSIMIACAKRYSRDKLVQTCTHADNGIPATAPGNLSACPEAHTVLILTILALNSMYRKRKNAQTKNTSLCSTTHFLRLVMHQPNLSTNICPPQIRSFSAEVEKPRRPRHSRPWSVEDRHHRRATGKNLVLFIELPTSLFAQSGLGSTNRER
ncbi:hypothetical protein WN51_06520 [Melipona quadrifasciata]|uniref:Uncharacterized protein n=1 Tax=Melipona quadrifasciata TaxID=166423 RepID=A0A0N0BCR5_9HYME|nr:hypothetical protein WN51_06520 [Melipona quadrifasciata]